MGRDLKGSTLKGVKMEMGSCYLVMGAHMKVISLIIRLKGMGFINGGMERYTKGIESKIK